MRMGRPIGANTLRICEIVEAVGPIAPIHIAEWVGLRQNLVRAYVCRAFDRGMLLRVDRKYVAAPNWREIASSGPKKVAPKRAKPLPPNSIFQLGDRALGAQP